MKISYAIQDAETSKIICGNFATLDYAEEWLSDLFVSHDKLMKLRPVFYKSKKVDIGDIIEFETAEDTFLTKFGNIVPSYDSEYIIVKTYSKS